MQSDLERFGSGESSEWHADLEHLRDMSACLRQAMLASFQSNLESFRLWWNCLESLERCVSPYCTPKERERIEQARARPIPDAYGVQRLNISVNLNDIRSGLSMWERALRSVIVAHGFAIRAREGDSDELSMDTFKKKSGLA